MKLQWIRKKNLSDYANKQNNVKRGLGKEKERERKKERVEKQYYGKRFQVTSLQARSRQEGTAQLLF